MNEKNVEIIEYITQLRISNFIKQNRNLDKNLLVEEVEKLLEEKEKMYGMEQQELEKILKNEKMES